MKKRWLIGSLLLLSATLYIQLFTSYSSHTDDIIITIPKGSTPHSIATILKKNRLIRSKTLFQLYTKLTVSGHKLRAGAFTIPPKSTLVSIHYLLQHQTGTANLIKVVIPEGFSASDIGKRLEKHHLVKEKDFVNFVHQSAKSKFENTFPFLKNIPVTTIEGYLFPDTYHFSPHSSQETIVYTMLSRFKQVILPLWQADPAKPKSPKKRFNFHQVATLASLIEKESRQVVEMPRISSVFYNRLHKRMRLASDPTVVYALGKSYKKRVYYKDLKVDSPYNTYKYSGFPPSPIASFGKAAFHASLSPEKTDYLFFVATKDGYHHFSKTYKNHLAIQRKKN